MTDVQRWQASINYLYPVNDETPMHSGRMEVILYADHVEAVKAAEQRVQAQFVNFNCVWGEGECVPNCPTCITLDTEYAERAAGFKEGFAAGVQAAREAVANADWVEAALAPIPTALAAIDALRGGS